MMWGLLVDNAFLPTAFFPVSVCLRIQDEVCWYRQSMASHGDKTRRRKQGVIPNKHIMLLRKEKEMVHRTQQVAFNSDTVLT